MGAPYNKASKTSQKLSVLVFAVMLLGSAVIVGTWRLKSLSFVSVHQSTLQPQVYKHDALIAHAVQPGNLRADDVISYYNPLNPNEIVTAKLVQSDARRGLLTIRSNANGPTTQLDSTLLVGKVRYRIAQAGLLLDFLRSKLGLVICIYLPALTIAGQELKRLSGNYDRQTYRLFGHLRYR